MRKMALIATVLILLQISLVALVLVQQGTWGGPDTDEAAGVAVAADGSVYVIGTTLSFGASATSAGSVQHCCRRSRNAAISSRDSLAVEFAGAS